MSTTVHLLGSRNVRGYERECSFPSIETPHTSLEGGRRPRACACPIAANSGYSERASSLTVAVGDQIISLPSESSQSVVRPSVRLRSSHLSCNNHFGLRREEMPRGRKQIDFAPPSLTRDHHHHHCQIVALTLSERSHKPTVPDMESPPTLYC